LEGGDQTWEPEIHVEDTVALTEFFTSRRKEPFFGLRIKFEQFSKLFKRAKYSYHLAIEQIIAVLKEFTAPDANQSEAIKQAQSLYSIGEVKRFIEVTLNAFNDYTKQFSKCAGSDTENSNRGSRKRSHEALEMDIENFPRAIDEREQPLDEWSFNDMDDEGWPKKEVK